MTSSIGPLPAGQTPSEPAGQGAAEPAGAVGAAANKPVEAVSAPDAVTPGVSFDQAGEAVTLSTDAQSTAQLLDAARAADGVDAAKVAQLREAVQSGSYAPQPEDVAKAIAGAFTGGAVPGPPG